MLVAIKYHKIKINIPYSKVTNILIIIMTIKINTVIKEK